MSSSRLTDLPARLHRLPELASDLWWVWNHSAREVFRALDYDLWRATAHNPVRLLRTINPERLTAMAQIRCSCSLYGHLHQVASIARSGEGTAGISATGRPPGTAARSPHFSGRSSRSISRCRSTPAASACWPAITARKPATSACRSSASASCIRRATSTSSVSPEGWQEEGYREAGLDRTRRSKRRLMPDGKPLRHRGPARQPRTVLVTVWQRPARSHVSFICSTPISKRTRRETASCRRASTAAIAKRASSRRSSSASAASAPCARSASTPAVWHLNEGHAAFVVLQRIHDVPRAPATPVRRRRSQEVRRTTVFTTHTPVPGRARCASLPSSSRSTSPAAGARSAATAIVFRGARAVTTTARRLQFNMTAPGAALRRARSTRSAAAARRR